jgi:hypothetical protein
VATKGPKLVIIEAKAQPSRLLEEPCPDNAIALS